MLDKPLCALLCKQAFGVLPWRPLSGAPAEFEFSGQCECNPNF